jgi:hypothetical protein
MHYDALRDICPGHRRQYLNEGIFEECGMNKVVVASLLALAAVTAVVPGSPVAFAQSPANLGSGAQGGAVELPAAEANAYNSAASLTDPKAKAPALEAYLTQYPQSTLKKPVLEQLMQAYSSFDPTKTLDAADRLLQLDPTNLSGLFLEAYFRKAAADSITDPAAKQAALDTATSYAQKALDAPKPKEVSDADFQKMKDNFTPTLYSVIGIDSLLKKDTSTAITDYTKEISLSPPAATQTPGSVLQDMYFMALAYMQSTPPQLLKCAFYSARVAAYAPANLKPNYEPTAKYCYKKFHGKDDGYDALAASAQANVNPPAGFLEAITPAPTPADIVKQVIAGTPDLAALAVSDKEFILANGSTEDATKVWDTVKGKSVELPDVLVIESSPTVLKVAVSDDAVQSKTADFTFNMAPVDDSEAKTPAQKAAAQKKADQITALTAVGSKVTLTGTYDSFTPNPVMITMSGGEVVLPKATPAKAPVHHPAAHK